MENIPFLISMPNNKSKVQIKPVPLMLGISLIPLILSTIPRGGGGRGLNQPVGIMHRGVERFGAANHQANG